MTPSIRILVAEDNVISRVGTVTLLGTQPDLRVVAEAEDGAEALEAYRREQPDVVIADLKMPKLDGVQLTAALAKAQPAGRVLVLTYYDGDENIFRALQAGALGYLTKDVRRADLFAAVRAVAAGTRYLPVAVAAQLAGGMLTPRLSAREQQVLEQIYGGLTNRGIAEALSISEKTVEMYVGNVLGKLGVKTRTQAVAVALHRGLLRVDP